MRTGQVEVNRYPTVLLQQFVQIRLQDVVLLVQYFQYVDSERNQLRTLNLEELFELGLEYDSIVVIRISHEVGQLLAVQRRHLLEECDRSQSLEQRALGIGEHISCAGDQADGQELVVEELVLVHVHLDLVGHRDHEGVTHAHLVVVVLQEAVDDLVLLALPLLDEDGVIQRVPVLQGLPVTHGLDLVQTDVHQLQHRELELLLELQRLTLPRLQDARHYALQQERQIRLIALFIRVDHVLTDEQQHPLPELGLLLLGDVLGEQCLPQLEHDLDQFLGSFELALDFLRDVDEQGLLVQTTDPVRTSADDVLVQLEQENHHARLLVGGRAQVVVGQVVQLLERGLHIVLPQTELAHQLLLRVVQLEEHVDQALHIRFPRQIRQVLPAVVTAASDVGLEAHEHVSELEQLGVVLEDLPHSGEQVLVLPVHAVQLRLAQLSVLHYQLQGQSNELVVFIVHLVGGDYVLVVQQVGEVLCVQLVLDGQDILVDVVLREVQLAPLLQIVYVLHQLVVLALDLPLLLVVLALHQHCLPVHTHRLLLFILLVRGVYSLLIIVRHIEGLRLLGGLLFQHFYVLELQLHELLVDQTR